ARRGGRSRLPDREPLRARPEPLSCLVLAMSTSGRTAPGPRGAVVAVGSRGRAPTRQRGPLRDFALTVSASGDTARPRWPRARPRRAVTRTTASFPSVPQTTLRPAARRPSGAPAIPNARAERKQADKQAAYAALRTLHVIADRQAVDWKLMRKDARPAPCSPCSRPAMAARYRPGPKPRNVAR